MFFFYVMPVIFFQYFNVVVSSLSQAFSENKLLSYEHKLPLFWFLSSLLLNLGVVFFLFLIILATEILLSVYLVFSSSLESFYPLFKYYLCFSFCIYLKYILFQCILSLLLLFIFWTPVISPYMRQMTICQPVTDLANTHSHISQYLFLTTFFVRVSKMHNLGS